jgi:hypothetical protein
LGGGKAAAASLDRWKRIALNLPAKWTDVNGRDETSQNKNLRSQRENHGFFTIANLLNMPWWRLLTSLKKR